MKALFLTIAFGLIAALRAENPLALPLEGSNVTGAWYVKALVTERSLPKEKRPMEMTPFTLDVLDSGHLEVSFTFRKKDQCHAIKIVLSRTEEPSKFRTSHGERRMSIEFLPVKGHYIVYTEYQFQGRAIHVAKLIGKTPDMNLEALDEFRKFTQRKGLRPEDIFMPIQRESCVPESY